MKVVIFGLSITSSWGNGHATTYRSLVKALADRGHAVHFIEKDVEWYRSHRDLRQTRMCKVVLYEDWQQESPRLLKVLRDADAIVIGSYFPDATRVTQALLDRGLGPILFYDIDTPITIARLRAHAATEYIDPRHIPQYAAYLSFTGGPILRELETRFGSPWAVPFYCSVDPDVYRRAPVRAAYRCDLSYLGTYASDRQAKLARLLQAPARALPEQSFVVAGAQYPDEIEWEPNVTHIEHLAPPEHAAFYSSSRFTLNLTRQDMTAAGYSPSVRLFEASACGAAIVTDEWAGLPDFLTPGEEVFVAHSDEDVRAILTGVSDEERCRMGQRARERILEEHSAARRAAQFEQVVSECQAAVRSGA